MKPETDARQPREPGLGDPSIDALRAWLDHPPQLSPRSARDRITQSIAPRSASRHPRHAAAKPWYWLAAAALAAMLGVSIGWLTGLGPRQADHTASEEHPVQQESIVLLELSSGTQLLVPLDTLASRSVDAGGRLVLPTQNPDAEQLTPPSRQPPASETSNRSSNPNTNRRERS